MSENPTIQVSFSKFHSLKPRCVRPRSKTPLISSLCCYCQNICLKLQAMNCPGLSSEYQFFDQFTCKKGEGNILRNAECMYKTCEHCRDWEPCVWKYFSDRIDMKKDIHWLSWITKKCETKNGKTSVRRILKGNDGNIEKCLTELIEKDVKTTLKRCNFFEHYYGHIFQFKMYKLCLNNLQPGAAMIIQDFSKNRDVYYQSEIKSSYWTRRQITMHPSVIYFKDMEGCSHRIVITHLSDYTTHNAHIVHYITKDCIEYLREHYPNIEWHEVIMWSDGCCSQYKGKLSFFYLNKLQDIFPHLKIQRNYFGSEHGKGESDSETGIFSRQIKDAISSETCVIDNASQMCDFLRETNKEDRIFRIFTESDLKYIYDEFKGVDVATLEGNCTRALHQIMPHKKNGSLLTRPFSCFCKNCQSDRFDSCKNKMFTKGKFESRILPCKDSNISCNATNIDYEEDLEDNSIDQDDLYNECKLPDEMQIKPKEISISDLDAMDFVITTVREGAKIEYFVAHILDIDLETNEVIINYLDQHSQHQNVFFKTDKLKWNHYAVPVKNICTKLPTPEECRRGNKYFFNKRINLRNIKL